MYVAPGAHDAIASIVTIRPDMNRTFRATALNPLDWWQIESSRPPNRFPVPQTLASLATQYTPQPWE